MPPKPGVASKRVVKELAEIGKELPDGIRAGLKNQDNLFEWYAQIDGPADSIYDGGVFDIDIVIPADYPFRPPRAQFRTKVYHMNINSQGGICLDILKNQWSPALSVTKVILCILSLLTDPNPSDPLVGEIASLYRRDKATHDRMAREWTRQYAKPEFAKPAVAIPSSSSKSKISTTITSSSSSTSTSTASSASGSNSASSSQDKTKKPSTSSSKPIIIDLDDDEDGDEDEEVQKATVGGTNRQSAAAGKKRKSEDGGAQEANRPASRQRLNGTNGGVGSASQIIELD